VISQIETTEKLNKGFSIY